MTRDTSRLLLALVAGIFVGLVLHRVGTADPVGRATLSVLEPLGSLWLKALKMTLVPLVFSLVAGAMQSLLSRNAGGRILTTSLSLFATLLVVSAVAGVAMSLTLFALWPIPQGVMSALIPSGAAVPPPPPGLVAGVLALLPDNPVAAAANGQMAPLAIFGLCFGWAVARLPDAQGRALRDVVEALGAAMMTIVQAVLRAAPIGVFALAATSTARAGMGLAFLLGQGIAMFAIVQLGMIALCLVVARLAGGIELRTFVRAAAAPQAISAGTCSSMASLPALMTAAERDLAIEPALARATLPLAVSIFRFGSVASITFDALFAATAAGVHLTPALCVIAALLALVASIGVPGVPGMASIYAAQLPVFLAVGAPAAFLPLWIAVFAIPDIFVTTGNVTGDLMAAAVIRRRLERRAATVPIGGEAAA